MTVDVVFRGDLVPGNNIFQVKEALKNAFKLDDTLIERMFGGKPVVLKRGLSEEAADKFQAAFFSAGAQVELKVVDSSVQSSGLEAETDKEIESSTAEELTLTPPGSAVLAEDEKASEVTADIDVSGLSLAPDGADVLDDKDKPVFESIDIDTSHIDVE